MLVAPLSIASGAVGFADYLRFYWTACRRGARPVAAAVRRRHDRAALSQHPRHRPPVGGDARRRRRHGRLGRRRRPVAASRRAGVRVSARGVHARIGDLLARVGAVALLAMYNYGGYNNVCNIAEEIREPGADVPRAIVVSILFVVALYIAMSTVIIGVIPWTRRSDCRRSRRCSSSARSPTRRPGRTRGTRDDGADPVRHRLVALRADSRLLARTVRGRARRPVLLASSRASTRPSIFRTSRWSTIGALTIPFCFFSARPARELADPGADPVAVRLAVRGRHPAAAATGRTSRSRS